MSALLNNAITVSALIIAIIMVRVLGKKMPRKIVAACPVAFGGIDVKNRIKNVVNYKRPAFWITIASIMVCAGVGVCFATNKSSEPVNEQQAEAEKPQAEQTVQKAELQNGVQAADGWVKVSQDDGLVSVTDATDEAASDTSVSV